MADTADLALLFDELSAEHETSSSLPVELPWGRDGRVGREVKLKYHISGPFWKTVAKGKWKIYNKKRQVCSGPDGFHCHLEVIGNEIKYDLRVTFRGRKYHWKNRLQVRRSSKCDECDRGRKNNRAHLHGVKKNQSIDAWPKNSDRTRVILKDGGKKYTIEIDTKE